MERHRYNSIISIAILAGLLSISGCSKHVTQEAGFLEGIISIGPICPVEGIPPDPACLPTIETYKAYPVSVWTTNGKRKIAHISPASDGSFKTALAPGYYQVVLEKEQNTVGGSNLPVGVSIYSQDKTILNINIDTGIR